MQRSLEKRVRSKMARFVAGKLSLRDFNRWFIPATWEIEEAPIQLREFVYSAKALLDDYDNGRLPKSALRYRFSLLLDSYRVLETEEFTVRGHIIAKASEPAESRRDLFEVVRSGVAFNPPSLRPRSGIDRTFEPRFQEVLG